MNKLLIILVYIIPLISCSNKDIRAQEPIDLNINFNASSTLIIHYQNAQDSISFETGFYNFFPSDYIENKTMLNSRNGIKKLTLNIQHPQEIDLAYADFKTTCFLIPNDTLELYINLDTNQNIKENIKYDGKYTNINNYYKNKELYFNKTSDEFNYSKAIAFNSINTISEYENIVDKLTQKELDYINNYPYKNTLPKWFLDFVITDIKCGLTSSKLTIISYRRDFLKQDISIPKDYYKKIEQFMIECPNSILSFSYFNYILNKFQDIYVKNFKDSNRTISKNYSKALIELSLQNLSPIESDIFLTNNIDMIIERNKLNDSIFSSYYNAIRDKKFKTYLGNRKKEKGDFLKLGENAPSFMLPEINGKEYQLKDFKGNIIYISFWFAGCAPCRAEFPDENKLVEKYKGKSVKFINICTLTSKENWKLVSKKYNLEMINLYVDEKLTPFIEKNYDINGYPHHVLIDTEGKIIQNKCKGAKNIEEEIDQLLKKIN